MTKSLQSIIFFLTILLLSVLNGQTRYTLAVYSGEWNQSSSWSPAGVPGVQDSVILTSGTVQIPTGQSITAGYIHLSNMATIENYGTLTLAGKLEWENGTITGMGKTIVDSGGTVEIRTGGVHNFEGTIENNGHFLVYAGNVGFLASTTLLTNNNTVELFNKGYLGEHEWGEFVNNGDLFKRDSTGLTELVTVFTNNGTIEITSGELALNLNSTLRGTIYIGEEGTLGSSYGWHSLYNPQLRGEGTLNINGGIFRVRETDLSLPGNLSIHLSNTGQLEGSANITINGVFLWEGGVLGDSATITLSKTASVSLTSPDTKWLGGRVVNQTAMYWNGGTVNLQWDAIFVNDSSFYALAANEVFGNNKGWLQNYGTLIQQGVEGKTTFSPLHFTNYGTLEIESTGFMECLAAFYNEEDGIIKGSGTFFTYNSFQKNSGTVSPGASPDTLHITGNFPQDSAGVLLIELGGYETGFNHDQLIVDGEANLAGTLSVKFIDGFVPQVGDSFIFLNYKSVSGRFDSLSIDGDSLHATVTYNSDHATLVVDGVTGFKKETEARPTAFRLWGNYPNPFNPATTIRYDLPARGLVVLTIYNSAGQKVRTLLNRIQGAGSKKVVWDGRNDLGGTLPSGAYYYRLTSGKQSRSGKMLLLK